MQNKWTTIGGIVLGVSGLLGIFGTFLTTGDLDFDAAKESWVAIIAGISLIKASDGGL